MISILMSCYNPNLDYLKAQIDSIIKQTVQDWELLIHPDDDDVRENGEIRIFVESYRDSRIRVVFGGHLGYAKAYNLLLSEAKGEYVCFCDQDDIWRWDKLEKEKGYLISHSDVDCVFSWLNWFGLQEKTESFHISDEDISRELLFWQPIKHPSAMFRKDRFGEFDSPYDYAGDYWFWSKHYDRKYHLIEEYLVNYRRHEGELTKNKEAFREATAKIIQRNMAMVGFDFNLDTCRALDRYSKTYDPELKRCVMENIFR